jgi:NIMA (never in mitosis gene a)-related kinase
MMELAEAGDLCGVIDRARAAGRHLHEAVVWHLFAQIASALCVMHERRVMHRDLKPANVFLGADRTEVKLGDLGVGRYLSSRTAQAFSLVGTPFYMSPEAISSSGYGFESDVWSLGCILYELAALASPFSDADSNYYSLGRRISRGTFTPLSQSVPASVAARQPELTVPTGLPPSQEGGLYSQPLEQLVASMLTVDPTQRPTAQQVLAWARKALSFCEATLREALAVFAAQDEAIEASHSSQ